MIAYFSTFTLSIFLCIVGEYYLNRNSKLGKFFFFLAVFVVSVLAGVRDDNIGTDISFYAKPVFNSALRSSNLLEFILECSYVEPLYCVTAYVVSRFTSDIHWLYFFSGFIIYFFVMKGIQNYRRQISITVAWIVFLFLYYCDTLNIMRQFMAVAIAFWGFKYVFSKKYIRYIIVTAVACLFHNTALISFLIFAVYLILNKRNTFFMRVVLVLGAALIGIFYSVVLEWLVNLGIVTAKYLKYINNSYVFSLNPAILRLPFLFAILLSYKMFGKGNGRLSEFDGSADGDFIIIMLFIDIITAQMRAIMPTLYRISFMFGIYRSVAYSRVCCLSKGNNKIILIIFLVMYLVVLWIYQNVIQGNNEVYPYTSKIFGIY